jgi:hypothetical protein
MATMLSDQSLDFAGGLRDPLVGGNDFVHRL